MTDKTIAPDPQILDRFAAIVGERHVIRDPALMRPHVTEPRGLFAGNAAMVMKPGNTSEVSAILALATQTGTPVVPQGGNTGLVGGQMPDRSGTAIVLCLARMNRLREVDTAGATMTVEAGAVLHDICQAADEAGLLFPLSLASSGTCQIGGNLSSNAGGTTALVHGTARDLCLGLEVVLPTGAIFDDLRKLKKDNTGYDLKHLFIGAEGTLGVITAAVLKLVPRPAGTLVAWIGLHDPDAALRLFHAAIASAGAALTTFELVAARPLEFTLRHMPDTMAPLAGTHPWFVMMEISSPRSRADARELGEAILSGAMEAGVIADAVLAESLAQQSAFWALRELMPDAQKHEGASIKHDISVPVHAVPAFIAAADTEVGKLMPQARVVCFGHMGDGNLHYNISQPPGADPKAFMARAAEFHATVHGVVRAHDGSISAEHGIGQMKRAELLATAPGVAIDLMRAVKRQFDPAGIMNPGKVI